MHFTQILLEIQARVDGKGAKLKQLPMVYFTLFSVITAGAALSYCAQLVGTQEVNR